MTNASATRLFPQSCTVGRQIKGKTKIKFFFKFFSISKVLGHHELPKSQNIFSAPTGRMNVMRTYREFRNI